MKGTAVGPRYMLDFHCIGDACEDQCCSGWTVRLSPEDSRRMGGILGKPVLDAFTRTLDGDSDGLYMEMRPNGSCVALREDGLCALQRLHGQEVLGGVCATYPRTVVRIGDRIEVAASVACPEVARLLLFDDRALDLVELGPEVGGQLLVVEGEDDLDIRVALAELVRDRRWALAPRILSMVLLLEGERPPEAALEAAVRSLATEPVDELMAMNIAVSVLLGRLQRWTNPGFRDLVCQAFASCSPQRAFFEPGKSDLPLMLELYQARRDFWTQLAPVDVDRIFSNYLANYWLVGLADGENLRRMRRLLALYVMQRLLFFSHPSLTEPAERVVRQGDLGDLAEPEVVQKLIREAAVSVMYSLTRNVEHAHRFLGELDFLMACESTSGRDALRGMARF